ncbi:MAG: hypothetical protein ACRCVV_10960 [Shewanella sp.]
MDRCFNIYGAGGAGINILNQLLKESKSQQFIKQVVGLDTSDANPAIDGLFEIERLGDTRGSGSDKSANISRYPDFVKQVLAKHQPNSINIVVFSASGGSGSGIGPFLVRAMLERDIPVLSVVIGDTTSIKEFDNTISTLRSLNAQTKLGCPVLFAYRENQLGRTQGEVNRNVLEVINNAVMMFNLQNERIDYADVKNFFFFTNVVKADPILTQVSFCNDENVKDYKRTPVACISLFNDIDQIKAPFDNLLYRKAGLFGPETEGLINAAHALLDHGSTLNELEVMMKQQETKQAELSGKYKVQKDLSQGSDDHGMFC